MSESPVEKLIIIGSGPAGLTAAIYAARDNLKPLVISGREAGGQLMLTTDVDDFPGFPEGIQGPELMEKIRKQAERFETRFVAEDVIFTDFSNRPFKIKTETQEFQTETVIVATGASAMWLGLESETKLRGKGISACAVCDGFFFKGKNVIVVGGGDTAMREAQHLSKVCAKVMLVHRRGELRAQAALETLLKSKPNVEFLLNSEIMEFMGEDPSTGSPRGDSAEPGQDKLTGVKIKNTETGAISEMDIDGVFIAIGHKPNTDFLKGQIELDPQGYIAVKNETHTSKEGIFVAGDVSDHKYRQGVTAAGAGCKAALDVEEYLEKVPLDERVS